MTTAGHGSERGPAGGWFRRLSAGYLLLLTLLLPLKFGTIAVMPEATSFFPETWIEYLYISWPAAGFGIASGIALVLAMAAWPRGLWQPADPGWRCAALWSVGLTVAALPGLRGATAWDFPWMELAHLGGIGAYAFAAYLYCRATPGHRQWLLGALTVGVLLLGWSGIEQYFWGFDRSRQYLLEQEAQGIAVNGVLKARAFDDRVFATFTGCNSLAGYLLLVTGPALAVIWNWCRRVEPVRWSRALFVGGAGIALTAVLLLTKSRAAYLSLLLTAAVFAALYPWRRRWLRAAIIAGVVAGIAAGGWYIHTHGRGFESMAARADYLRSSLLLLKENPLTGCGWGEFFFGHMRLKAIVSHEAAHDPHNLLMTAAQAGLPMLLLALAGMAAPLLVLARRVRAAGREGRPAWFERIVGFSLLAFYGHALMDIDVQIPAIMAAYTALLAAVVTSETAPASVSRAGTAGAAAVLAALALWSCGAGLDLCRGEMALDRLLTVCRTPVRSAEDLRRTSPEAMERALREAVNRRPRSSYPWGFAADYWLARNRLPEAEAYLDRALRLSPQRANLYQRKAVIARRRGDRAAAAVWLDAARRHFPNHPDYQPSKLEDLQ